MFGRLLLSLILLPLCSLLLLTFLGGDNFNYMNELGQTYAVCAFWLFGSVLAFLPSYIKFPNILISLTIFIFMSIVNSVGLFTGLIVLGVFIIIVLSMLTSLFELLDFDEIKPFLMLIFIIGIGCIIVGICFNRYDVALHFYQL